MTQERSHDKPLSEHTEVERQIIRYGFFRNTGRMEEAEECFRKIQAMLRSLPTAVPDCIGAQIANDTARALDDVAAKIMTGRNMAEKEARAVTSGARMLERLAIALPSAGGALSDAERAKVWYAEAEAQRKEVGRKQAEIDRLMIEYCPEKMTPEQIDEWRKDQCVVSPEDEAKIASAIRPTERHGWDCDKCGAKRPDQPCQDDGRGRIGCPEPKN